MPSYILLQSAYGLTKPSKSLLEFLDKTQLNQLLQDLSEACLKQLRLSC